MANLKTYRIYLQIDQQEQTAMNVPFDSSISTD